MQTSDYLEQLVQDRDDLVTNLTTQGITGLTGDETFTELVPQVLDIPTVPIEVEEKDVNFYDYDGTIVNSYTKDEFLALEELPENPTHEGLIAQGWNWTLSDAQTQMTYFDKLDIGQAYITDDNSTRIYITLNEDILKLYVGFAVNGTVTIDWGDNTTPSTVTGNDTSTVINTQHTYSQAGNYVISISGENTIYIIGQDTKSYLLNGGIINNEYISNAYLSCINKIELGNMFFAYQGGGNLGYCVSLKYITIPKELEFSGRSSLFYNCVSLKHLNISRLTRSMYAKFANNCSSLEIISLPKTIGEFYDNVFYNCFSLKRITGGNPNTPVILRNYAFYSCNKLKNIYFNFNLNQFSKQFSNTISLLSLKISNQTTSFSGQLFENSGVLFVDFTSYTVIPTLSNTYLTFPKYCSIIVPDNLYDDWIVATNWTTYASQIISESDWNTLQNNE